MKVAVVKESAPGERRVALVPEAVPRDWWHTGAEVLVENGAGEAAWFPDSVYANASTVVITGAELYAKADVILTVPGRSTKAIARTRPGRPWSGCCPR